MSFTERPTTSRRCGTAPPEVEAQDGHLLGIAARPNIEALDGPPEHWPRQETRKCGQTRRTPARRPGRDLRSRTERPGSRPSGDRRAATRPACEGRFGLAFERRRVVRGGISSARHTDPVQPAPDTTRSLRCSRRCRCQREGDDLRRAAWSRSESRSESKSDIPRSIASASEPKRGRSRWSAGGVTPARAAKRSGPVGAGGGRVVESTPSPAKDPGRSGIFSR